MGETMDIQEYLTAGVENLTKNVVKVTLKNPAQNIFMARFAAVSQAASRKRKASEKAGEHVPAFLIASITSSCNLHCAGCYARAVHSCADSEPVAQLSAEEWGHIFEEAEEMGISFILLAGGEPMIRRNLIPIFSVEGKEKQTDVRRGEGVYRKVFSAMEVMKKEKLLFGSSVTVTKENLEEVTSDTFINSLAEQHCKALFFVEFVPMSPELKELAPGDTERKYMNQRLAEIRNRYPNMIFLSFPGDEKSSGGCIAAGRGFLHINSHGGAEPCPFSPYSDVNVTKIKRIILLTGIDEEGKYGV